MNHDTVRPTDLAPGKLPTSRMKMFGIAAVAAMALFLAALAFTLSFDALRALAIEIGVQPGRAWMAPVAIDVAQAAATAGYVIFRISGAYAYARMYCMALAIVTVALSVVGNAYHAWQMAGRNLARVAAGEDLGFVPQTPWIAAVIAAIFPLLWLALFHLFTMLLQVVLDERALRRNATSEGRHASLDVDMITSSVAATADAETNAQEDESTSTAVAPSVHPVVVSPERDVDDLRSVASGKEPPVATVQDAATCDDMSVAAATEPNESVREVTRSGYPQTQEGLLTFLNDSNFHETVKIVASMLITEPGLKQIDVAQRIQVDKSTVSRRWRLFVAAAETEGFLVPPLPTTELGEVNHELQRV